MTAALANNVDGTSFGVAARLLVNGLPHEIRMLPATTFFSRLRGLLGRRGLSPSNMLLLEPCNAIHTCFMRFAIDVIFVARDGEVLSVHERLRPYRAASHRRGHYCLELAAGGAARLGIHPGQRLEWNLCE